MPELTSTDNEAGHDTVERLNRTLDEWRGRIDELLVQVDLAGHEVRDTLRKQIDATENAYLAARSQLSQVRQDATNDAGSLCEGTEKLIRDLQHVYEAAAAALKRGSGK